MTRQPNETPQILERTMREQLKRSGKPVKRTIGDSRPLPVNDRSNQGNA